MGARYHFLTEMTLSSTPEAVEEMLSDVATWPQWWRWAQRTEPLNDLAPGTVGARYRHRIRTPLAYGFDYVIEVVRAEPGRIDVTVSGDLDGTGEFTYETTPSGATALSLSWRVRTRKWWMNAIRPLAGAVFSKAHDVLMDDFVDGLARVSGGHVLSIEHSRLRAADSRSGRGRRSGRAW